ncbi:MAG TPA: FAD-binding oxidoreductase [Candidatus Limnocylindrales bacterium]|nr:FAD-binding oxidoreductase [Candidatus Limnocylindrales bacterium]
MSTLLTLRPGDDGYEDSRRVHNGMIDRRPALIARPRSAAEVAEAVRLARSEGLALSVRGGGHSIAGRAVIDGGLTIDLGSMRAIDVHPVRRLARVGAGATWGEVNDATSAHGLATTGGVVSTTGVGGLTLGGGLGWLMGAYGLAVDNLVSVELVTAGGEILDLSEASHPDLFWAVRGGGGNFGVATRFDFRLHPVAGVIGGLVAHPFAAARDLFRFVRDMMASATDELALMPLLVHAPDGSAAPIAAVAVCHAGDPGQAERELAPLLAFGSPILSQVGPMSYPALNTMLDPGFPRGALYYWKSSFSPELSDALLDTLVERFPASPSPMNGVAIEHFHGALTRVPVDATAVPHRAPSFDILVAGVWREPESSEANVAWVRETYEALRPYLLDRRYANYLSADDDAARAAFGPNYDRLVEVKRRYDPEDVFHGNQPLGTSG